MCSIIGWNGNPGEKNIRFIIESATARGRDGWGFQIDGKEYRGLGRVPGNVISLLLLSQRVVGNFRATPTTEEESREDNLQPYKGIVHNGTIANDRDYQENGIDSMVLPQIIKKDDTLQGIDEALKKIKGSYAIAFFRSTGELVTAVNYKPIYLARIGSSVMFASQVYMLPVWATPHPVYSIGEHTEDATEYFSSYKAKNKKVVVSCSGGLDSTTVAYMLKKQGYEVHLVYFLYKCLAERMEFKRVLQISEHGNFPFAFIALPSVFSGTIVEGEYHKKGAGESGAEYAHDWVSARNLLMLSILTAYAETNNFSYIAFGGNLEESGAYPDNEEEFGNRFNAILPFSTQNGMRIELLQPLSTYMKHEIIKLGEEAGVPFHYTWSCYSGKKKHCGECGPCYMRKKAFERNGLIDPVMED